MESPPPQSWWYDDDDDDDDVATNCSASSSSILMESWLCKRRAAGGDTRRRRQRRQQCGDDDDDNLTIGESNLGSLSCGSLSEDGYASADEAFCTELPVGEGERTTAGVPIRKRLLLQGRSDRREEGSLRRRVLLDITVADSDDYVRKLLTVIEGSLFCTTVLAPSLRRVMDHPRRLVAQERIALGNYTADTAFYAHFVKHRALFARIARRELMCSTGDGMCWYWRDSLWRRRRATDALRYYCVFGCCRTQNNARHRHGESSGDDDTTTTTTTTDRRRRRPMLASDERVRLRLGGRRVCVRKALFCLYYDQPPPIAMHMCCGEERSLEPSENLAMTDSVFRDNRLRRCRTRQGSDGDAAVATDDDDEIDAINRCLRDLFNPCFADYEFKRQHTVTSMHERVKHDHLHLCMNPAHMVLLQQNTHGCCC